MTSRRYPNFPIPGVGGVVLSPKGILLVRRDKEPGKGLWSIPGGGVEVGETQEEALKREVLEETGIHCKVLRLISTADIIYPDENDKIEFHYLLNHYLAEAVSGELKPESSEAEVGWFLLNRLPLAEMPESIIEVIEKAKEFLNDTDALIRET